MRVTIDFTDEIAIIDGVQCRIWNGHADNGVPVRMYVHRVAVPIELPQRKFEKELIPQKAPQTERIVKVTE
jgi:hypothetical protein